MRTLCSECDHRLGISGLRSVCKKNRLNFVGNGYSSFQFCEEINKDGQCPDYSPNVPHIDAILVYKTQVPRRTEFEKLDQTIPPVIAILIAGLCIVGIATLISWIK